MNKEVETISIEEVEAMMEEDESLFDEDCENTSERKAFELGKKIGEFTQKPVVKIGGKILKAAAVLGAGYLAYKKGFSDGVNSSESWNLIESEPDDEELKFLEQLENEEVGSNEEEEEK